MRMKHATCLLFSTASGVLALLGLFVFCFAIVHLFKLASLGRKFQKQSNTSQKTSPTPTQPQNEAKSESKEKQSSSQTPEPVYYIVERKRRTKSSFGNPKRIHFNQDNEKN